MSSRDVRTDRRGRIPFALLGVLLLVSSLTLAPTLAVDPAPRETAVERALERTTAETQTAIRTGVDVASQRAAASPVIEPANTTAGRALNDSTAFRDALRLRVYLQVHDRLERVSYTTDGVTVTASLPATSNTSALREAMTRIHIEQAGSNGTAVRATVENVTLRVRRSGRTITTKTVSPTVVVPTPVLLLHEQVETYDRRLNNGLTKPGLNQRLTARLYPITWARGYAQYGGAPIENVVANRHVSLATNGALLGVQRSTFGRSDPDGRAALTEATAVTGIEDLVRGSPDTPFASRVLDKTAYRPPGEDISTVDSRTGQPRPNGTMQIAVNETADTAFRAVAEPAALNETLRDAYSVEVRLTAEREFLGGSKPSRPPAPGSNWTLVGTTTERALSVTGSTADSIRAPAGWHTLDTFGRVLEREYTRTAVWENGGSRRLTTSSSTERWRVSVGVLGRHESESAAPDRPITTAHTSRSGPLGGPNLADVEAKAEERLVGRRGGRDGVAKQVVRDGVDTTLVTVAGERPPGLRAWVYRDLMALRKQVRKTSVTVERGSVGTFEANPPDELRTRLAERRNELEGVPDTYAYTAQKARVAARIAYLNAVDAQLKDRSNSRTNMGDRLADELGKRTNGSLAELRRGLTARETQIPRSRPAPVGPAGQVRTRVDARPQYLTLAKLSEETHPSVNGSEHPLAARNVNVFTIPYGGAASAVVGGLSTATDRVRLSTAAATLAAADRTARNTTNASLDAKHATLRERVAAANANVRRELVRRVRKETPASHRTSQRIVSAAMADVQTPAARGLRYANGSAADRIATVAAQRQNLTIVERDWLRLQLHSTTSDALNQPIVRPESKLVNETASSVRSVANSELQRVLADAGRRRAEKLAKRKLGTKVLPAGLPIAPPLTPWYATTNVWWVTIDGEYARFAVTANHGSPSTPCSSTTYARDGDEVRVDVDDDGTRELLGNATRVSFHADTGIVVVVPPKPRGVGDKDGVMTEESSGWPEAGS